MAKNTNVFYCTECGYEVSKWCGFCPGCHAANTMVEAPKDIKLPHRAGISGITTSPQPKKLREIDTGTEMRCSTGFPELDRVLGGGIVSGSLLLIGGDPGIGKSTLLLQVCRELSGSGHKVLYISGEESLRQIRLRADRIGSFTDDILFLCETDMDTIAELIRKEKPETVVIDSIQTMCCGDASGAPGSVTQVRECTSLLLNLAKSLNITVFIIGHVTKEGTVAGPRMLEHMVDTVLYFEGDRHASYRVLRGVKNRFGGTNEIGVFEMQSQGLVEVPNPSAFLLSGRPENVSGSVISCVMEGTRPLLLEVQALVARTNFPVPRRTAAGTDYNRVNLLMAVLEKRCSLSLSDCDAYINITGGMKVSDPALDLGIVLSVYSSYRNLAIDPHTVIFGEVGLSGEVRMVPLAEQRIQEALRLGYTTCILPKSALSGRLNARGMKLVGVSTLEDAIQYLKGQN